MAFTRFGLDELRNERAESTARALREHLDKAVKSVERKHAEASDYMHKYYDEKERSRALGERVKAMGDLGGVLSRAEGTMNLAAAYLSKASAWAGDLANGSPCEHHQRSLQIAAGDCFRARQLLDDLSPKPLEQKL